MKIRSTKIDGCFIIENKVYPDERGIFREWYKATDILEIDRNFKIAQANFSISKKGVIRGLHYSLAPEGQSKIVTCVHGVVLDFLVDIRIGSPTFGEQVRIELRADSGVSVLIDRGIAHGFSVSSAVSAICYLTSSDFSPEFEKSINPLDQTLNVDWGQIDMDERIISKADNSAMTFEYARTNGLLPIFTKRTDTK